MKVFPAVDRVLVRKMEASTVTKGGIFIPNNALSMKTNFGVIIAVGECRITDSGAQKPIPFKVGQNVIYDAYAGSPVTINGVEHLLLLSDDVLSTVEMEEKDDLALMN
jgi:chaperonin GroES